MRVVVLTLCAVACACGDSKVPEMRAEPAADGSAGRAGGGSRSSGSAIPGIDNPGGLVDPDAGGIVQVAPRGCGNGVRTEDEACDDGNQVSGDGCSSDCLAIELGFSCHPPGKPCRIVARCGDGLVATSETCDDGNADDGDGCSAKCKIELGWKCEGEPSACSETTCGDGVAEGTESCDDGNDLPFDGCSATCQTEPDCSAGACTSKCGDGLVLAEECDDGNDKDGDGCSSECKLEDGFMCTTDASCEMRDGACILRVPAVFRDFDETHSDFAVGCGQLVTGLVEDTLSEQGKPVLRGNAGGSACIQSAASFAEWYTSNDKNATIPSELTLFDNGRGGFVNRYGAAGEPWPGRKMYTNIVYGGMAGMGCGMCTPSAMGQCFDPCEAWMNADQACCADMTQDFYDGNPLFFPIDDSPGALRGMRYRAKVPEQYGYDGWPWEDAVLPGAGMHNFHFTTEVVYWFKYDDSTSAVLDFSGDDDVWVFVNNRLAIDLGGPHVPEDGTLTVNAQSAARFGLMPDNVYEVRVLHAERKVEGSSFKLTLSGFNTARSECTPICGDGVVTLGEECDDGVNDGGYEECDVNCVLGPSCGDGIVQEGEDCDDGNRRDGDSCGSSCRNLELL